MCDTGYLAWFLMALFLLVTNTCSVKGSQSQRNWVLFFLGGNCCIAISIVENEKVILRVRNSDNALKLNSTGCIFRWT